MPRPRALPGAGAMRASARAVAGARGVARPVAGVLAAASLLALSGCAATGPSARVDPRGLDGITASVGQGRVDVADGRIFVLVENGRDEPVTVNSIEVRSAGFEPGIADHEPTEFPAGRAIAIRLDPTAAICDAEVAPITVSIQAVTSDGDAFGDLEADDAYDALQRIHDQACLAEAVAEVAEVTLPDGLRSTGSGADRRAVIDVGITPTGETSESGETGAFRIDLVSGTTLIRAEGAHDWQLGLDVRADDPPSTLQLAVAPNRCDAHAVAEDKVGTILPFDITIADGTTGTVPLAAGESLRAELYAYYAERCGLPTG